jgi:hypothetical protein
MGSAEASSSNRIFGLRSVSARFGNRLESGEVLRLGMTDRSWNRGRHYPLTVLYVQPRATSSLPFTLLASLTLRSSSTWATSYVSAARASWSGARRLPLLPA